MFGEDVAVTMMMMYMLKVEDGSLELQHKCQQLAAVIQNARNLVVYTGAGISTV